ncbi:predicted protein [Postia placenta Mad-698-R]|uniref:Uncharacterized protein n=1 Tax=Postia placenta MAD-698-R-SB12 TaxID=670580 RepID=A0A1X6MXE8_9APHY|nr:hypothetical protein POSPLADRAFT_1047217 [Postia placenta MAD-698-R-SB12]EED85048.1 predicted protein [Postia placenta Mad-698-R]OSX60893.1 hypothetical protein POSPLADRAFT_1047217 [Postia placenta MAD-698-R-SB12]
MFNLRHCIFGNPLWTPWRKHTLRIQEYLAIVNIHLAKVRQPASAELMLHIRSAVSPAIQPADYFMEQKILPIPVDNTSMQLSAPLDVKQTALTLFFSRCSREQHQQHLREEADHKHKHREELAHRRMAQAIKKVERQRELARARKQKSRVKQKLKEIAEGVRDADGKLKKLACPDVVKSIVSELSALQKKGIPVSLLTAHAIMVAHIKNAAPELLTAPVRKGVTFKCSDHFMRTFLKKEMDWGPRKPTRSAQKIPADAMQQCLVSFARQARKIRDYGIPSACHVNIDQTNVQLLMSMRKTFKKIRSNQVASVGNDENYVDNILVLYFMRQKESLHLPDDQPCDTGIQQPLKHVIRQAQHADLVAEALDQIKNKPGGSDPQMKVDMTLGTLRDRSVGWLVDAYRAVNKPEIVKKAFELCQIEDKPYNLSHQSLTSHAALQLLRNIEQNEPDVWQLVCGYGSEAQHAAGANADEPLFMDEMDELIDDASIPFSKVVDHIHAGSKMALFGYILNMDGSLSACAAIEQLNHDGLQFTAPRDLEIVGDQLQKRCKMA